MRTKKLIKLLDRWEQAYTGYALQQVPLKQKKKLSTVPQSKENIPQLLLETRKAVRIYKKTLT